MDKPEIISTCIELGCFKHGVFTLKSGKKSNYYIDLRSIISYPDFLKEFWEFLNERKKYWLLPIIIVLALFGVLIVLSQGSAVAPFIYTIF